MYRTTGLRITGLTTIDNIKTEEVNFLTKYHYTHINVRWPAIHINIKDPKIVSGG